MPAHRFRRFTDVPDRTCAVLDCEKKPRSGRQTLCNMHYQQQWKQTKTCTIEGCERTYLAKGMCVMHYKRAAKGVDMHAPRMMAPAGTPCDAEDCDKPRHLGGYCGMHSQRLKRTGDLDGRLSPLPRTGCLVEDCANPHMSRGYCHGHGHRLRRYGAAEPVKPCVRCGTPFVRRLGKVGSYDYCAACEVTGTVAWAALRRARRAANNLGMTAEDRAQAAEYRAIIANDPCVYCGVAYQAADHIVPVLHGGADRWDNFAPTCRPCNSAKHSRSVLEYLMTREASRADRAPGRQAA